MSVKSQADRFRHDVTFVKQLERIERADKPKEVGPSLGQLKNETTNRCKKNAGHRTGHELKDEERGQVSGPDRRPANHASVKIRTIWRDPAGQRSPDVTAGIAHVKFRQRINGEEQNF